jgi:low affinity Fe/Cu permease
MFRNLFSSFAITTAQWFGSPAAFIGALAITLLWLASYPLFGSGDTWQLVYNTITSLVTFIAVFIIQATQNRDTRATQLKLDELLAALHTARNDMIDVESLTDDQLDHLEERYRRYREKCVAEGRGGPGGRPAHDMPPAVRADQAPLSSPQPFPFVGSGDPPAVPQG